MSDELKLSGNPKILVVVSKAWHDALYDKCKKEYGSEPEEDHRSLRARCSDHVLGSSEMTPLRYLVFHDKNNVFLALQGPKRENKVLPIEQVPQPYEGILEKGRVRWENGPVGRGIADHDQWYVPDADAFI